ncbi:MAG: HlyD family secretion protein [Syntrophomonadales bacterium]|jgi:HlyD family secretion protein
MSKAKRALILAVVLCLGIGSYYAYQTYFSQKTQDIQASGTIEATIVDLNAPVAGVIKSIAAQEGYELQEGQVAAEISRSDLLAQRERDAMALMKAEAQLADLRSGFREQEISEAEANLAVAQATAQKSADDLKNREVLFAEGGISQEELERYRLAAEIDQNKLKAAEAKLSMLQSGNRPEVIAAAQAEVERSRAVLKATEAMISDLQIRCPMTGTVVQKNYEPGEYVMPGASVLTVADLQNLWIKVYIPTDDLPAVKLNQKVKFTVSGDSRTFTGTVSEIASKGEFTPKTIQTKKERTNVVFGVKIRVDDADGMLKPGMPADVTITREG